MRKLFSKIKFSEMSLELSIFFLIAFSGILIALVATLTNIPLGLGIITVITPVVFIILTIPCIIYSIKTKKWFVPSLLVVMYSVLILFPIIWFSSGGATGSTLPYLIMSSFIAVIMFHGKLRIFILITIPALFSFFIYLEMLHPDICVPYPSRTSHYMDLIIGFTVSFTVTAILGISVLSRYRKAKLESEELVKKLGEISVTDSLTGIHNRRMLTAGLDEEMRKSYDNYTPLTICLIDIDHFKQINDIYGHVRGDEVLIDLAQLLTEFMTENDILGRYGGEEFLIIFKNQTLQEALATVEMFHKAVQALDPQRLSSVTISCGINEYVKGISYSDFVNAADKCLYEAKTTGRNRIIYK